MSHKKCNNNPRGLTFISFFVIHIFQIDLIITINVFITLKILLFIYVNFRVHKIEKSSPIFEGYNFIDGNLGRIFTMLFTGFTCIL